MKDSFEIELSSERLEKSEKEYKKMRSRFVTKKYIENSPEKIDFVCNKCGEKNNLDIHHNIYPLCKKGVKRAIEKEKIFYLCKSCHRKWHIENEDKELEILEPIETADTRNKLHINISKIENKKDNLKL